MTDLEKLKALLTEFGVPFTVETCREHDEAETQVWVTSDSDHEKITGYMGFFTTYEFDLSGKFLRMGAWE